MGELDDIRFYNYPISDSEISQLYNESTNTTPVLPTLTTTTASAITYSTAISGGTITSDGGATVTARGVCWSTTSNPTIADSFTTDGSGTGIFTSSITGLIPYTAYYVRAYATNKQGTAYGNEVTFTTNADQILTFDTGIDLIGTLSDATYNENGMKITFSNIAGNCICDLLGIGTDGKKLYMHGTGATATFQMEDGSQFQLQGLDLQTNGFGPRVLKTSSGVIKIFLIQNINSQVMNLLILNGFQ